MMANALEIRFHHIAFVQIFCISKFPPTRNDWPMISTYLARDKSTSLKWGLASELVRGGG